MDMRRIKLSCAWHWRRFYTDALMSCTIPTIHSAHTHTHTQARAHTHSSRIHHTIHSGLLHTQFYSIYPAIQIYVILGRCANKSHIMFDSLVSMLFVHCTVYRVLCTVSHTQKFRTLCVCCIWNWNEWAFVTLADTHTQAEFQSHTQNGFENNMRNEWNPLWTMKSSCFHLHAFVDELWACVVEAFFSFFLVFCFSCIRCC